jgi:hypothetical protein
MSRIIGVIYRKKRVGRGETGTLIGWRHRGEIQIQTLVNDPREKAEIEFVRQIQPGDTIVTMIGGPGGHLWFALTQQCARVGGKSRFVRVLPQHVTGTSDENRLTTLIQLAESRPDLLLPVSAKDLIIINLQLAWDMRMGTTKERISRTHRLQSFGRRQGFITNQPALDALDLDPIYTMLKQEEAAHDEAVAELLKKLPEWEIFEEVPGCGPAIAAGLITAIVDIRRFPTPSKLKKFCGVHVTKSGELGRHRRGEASDFSVSARQALNLFGKQLDYRSKSRWGKRYREFKKSLALQHPQEIDTATGKTRYSPAHIRRMAVWRTLTKFVEWLWREMTELSETQSV